MVWIYRACHNGWHAMCNRSSLFIFPPYSILLFREQLFFAIHCGGLCNTLLISFEFTQVRDVDGVSVVEDQKEREEADWGGDGDDDKLGAVPVLPLFSLVLLHFRVFRDSMIDAFSRVNWVIESSRVIQVLTNFRPKQRIRCCCIIVAECVK